MYQAHFGLKSRPFGSKAGGAAVFVGPTQTATIKALKKSLAVADAVVSVTGAVGVGKTTIVNRALETISPGRMVAWVGRMPLAPEEVLRLLLVGFGIKTQSKSTIHRFAAFRRFQAERAATGMQVAIVVEDALRLGVEALVELEALTAADTGDGTSANIILMGQSGINKLLATPELARLKQRNRLRQNVEALTMPEVMGYLKHCIRTAGGEFEQIFDAGVTDIVFACTEGIPRMINTLCENALNAAAENKSRRVSAVLMHQVAADTFGYEGPLPEVSADTNADFAAETQHAPTPVEAISAAAPASELPAANTAQDDEEIGWESPPPRREATQASAAESIVERNNSAAARRVERHTDESHEPPAAGQQANIETAGSNRAVADAAAADISAQETAKEHAAKSSTKSVEKSVEEPADDMVGPDLPHAARNIVVESGRYPESASAIDPPQEDLPDASTEAAIQDAVSDLDVDDIPELINDTQPELARLNPADVSAEADLPVLHAHDPAPGDDEDTASTASHKRPAIRKDDSDASAGSDDEDIDLDDVLSPDVDETNVMRGITPDVDAIAADARQTEEAEPARASNKSPEPVEAPAAPAKKSPLRAAKDELPTLSDSMRVNVEKKASSPAEKADHSGADAEIDAELARAAALLPDDADANIAAGSDVDSAALASAQGNSGTDDAAEEDSADDASAEFELSLMQTGKLQPDPAELQAALDSANADKVRETKQQPAAKPVADKTPAAVPEITLDEKIGPRKADKKVLDEMAEAIGKANSLEDFNDIMAETLFGCEEFDQIAAQVIANPPPGHEPAAKTPDKPSPVRLDENDIPPAANDADEVVSAKADPNVLTIGDQTLPPLPEYGGLKESMALRIEMLNAMKQNARKSPPKKTASPPKPKVPQPEPIEKQIHTSLTQTLETLKLSKVPADDDNSGKKPKAKKSGGLFSRFKKSS